jgi:hypothetical protein
VHSKSKKTNSNSIFVIVQEIYTYWTKSSRGGTNASARNKTPRAHRIPIELLPKNTHALAHHHIAYSEISLFREPTEQIKINPVSYPTYGCTTVEYHHSKGVWANYSYSSNKGGAPYRQHIQQRLYAPINQWVQVCENGRFSPAWDGDWWYQKVVINAGAFENITSDIFTTTAPLQTFEALADLW